MEIKKNSYDYCNKCDSNNKPGRFYSIYIGRLTEGGGFTSRGITNIYSDVHQENVWFCDECVKKEFKEQAAFHVLGGGLIIIIIGLLLAKGLDSVFDTSILMIPITIFLAFGVMLFVAGIAISSSSYLEYISGKTGERMAIDIKRSKNRDHDINYFTKKEYKKMHRL